MSNEKIFIKTDDLIAYFDDDNLIVSRIKKKMFKKVEIPVLFIKNFLSELLNKPEVVLSSIAHLVSKSNFNSLDPISISAPNLRDNDKTAYDFYQVINEAVDFYDADDSRIGAVAISFCEIFDNDESDYFQYDLKMFNLFKTLDKKLPDDELNYNDIAEFLSPPLDKISDIGMDYFDTKHNTYPLYRIFNTSAMYATFQVLGNPDDILGDFCDPYRPVNSASTMKISQNYRSELHQMNVTNIIVSVYDLMDKIIGLKKFENSFNVLEKEVNQYNNCGYSKDVIDKIKTMKNKDIVELSRYNKMFLNNSAIIDFYCDYVIENKRGFTLYNHIIVEKDLLNQKDYFLYNSLGLSDVYEFDPIKSMELKKLIAFLLKKYPNEKDKLFYLIESVLDSRKIFDSVYSIMFSLGRYGELVFEYKFVDLCLDYMNDDMEIPFGMWCDIKIDNKVKEEVVL